MLLIKKGLTFRVVERRNFGKSSEDNEDPLFTFRILLGDLEVGREVRRRGEKPAVKITGGWET